MTTTHTSAFRKNVLDLLFMNDDDGDHYAATGITLTMMYAQSANDMLPVFRQMLELFDHYLGPIKLDSYKRSDTWRDYSPSKHMNRLLNVFTKDFKNDEELVLAKLDGHFQYFSEYGVRLKGRLYDKDSPFRDSDVCAAYFELPLNEIQRVGRKRLLWFVAEVANLAPFAHGMCGYTFKYFHRAGDHAIYEWMGHNILRFSAIHPFMNKWEYYCRNHLPNVNWVTLLGTDMVARLGANAIEQGLSSQVETHTLKHGRILVAGQEPPLGDVNYQALDLGPLREVARLTKPLLLPREIQSSDILNYLLDDGDKGRWLDRFEVK